MVKVRFAPSPTGFLHVGGARTALYNWLFARHEGGEFILRIEDTDSERSTPDSVKAILDGLEWLGLNWDIGPIFQSGRRHLYNFHLERLVEKGMAYRCFCTPDELREKREEARRMSIPPRYDGKCRNLGAGEHDRLLNSGKPFAVRFHVREGKTSFDDIIHGMIEFDNSTIGDFVLKKSDGFPTYNFAAAVDDSLMGITHVIRGDDHIANTPKQILILEALELPPSRFGHIPMILGSDRSRLSKRHGATSIEWYKNEGFLPSAMFNYLALLGWSYDGTQEYFAKEELVQKFDLERVSDKAAVFDIEKLRWMNGTYVKNLTEEDRCSLSSAYLAKVNLISLPLSVERKEYLKRVLRAVGDRLKLISQIAEYAGYFFKDEFAYDEQAFKKHLSGKEKAQLLTELSVLLSEEFAFDKDELEKRLRDLASRNQTKTSDYIHPLRVALSGKSVGPGIFDVVEILGRERVLERLKRAIDLIGDGT
ncbi:MAG: glutamate--tRNA ligase [Candidatus Eisenbacteria bacterium]|nr:glutamate--tRNA ligase [Candidatus Eisenbacteria bacterium]